jgi:hypothetical protein
MLTVQEERELILEPIKVVENKKSEIVELFDSLPSAGMEDPNIRMISLDMFQLVANQLIGMGYYHGERQGWKAGGAEIYDMTQNFFNRA